MVSLMHSTVRMRTVQMDAPQPKILAVDDERVIANTLG